MQTKKGWLLHSQDQFDDGRDADRFNSKQFENDIDWAEWPEKLDAWTLLGHEKDRLLGERSSQSMPQ